MALTFHTCRGLPGCHACHPIAVAFPSRLWILSCNSTPVQWVWGTQTSLCIPRDHKWNVFIGCAMLFSFHQQNEENYLTYLLASSIVYCWKSLQGTEGMRGKHFFFFGIDHGWPVHLQPSNSMCRYGFRGLVFWALEAWMLLQWPEWTCSCRYMKLKILYSWNF